MPQLMIYFAVNAPSDVTRAQKLMIRRAAEAVLFREGVGRPCELSVTLTGDAGIRELNREHRGLDKPTDVLSFPLCSEEDIYNNAAPSVPVFSKSRKRRPGIIRRPASRSADPLPLGDIVISTETAARQAAALGQSYGRELAFLCAHSVLHLLGFDHERSRREDSFMRRRQRSAMRILRRSMDL